MSSIKDLRKVQTDDRDLNKVQDNLEVYLAPITKCPVIDGVLLKDVVLSTSFVNVEHKLGRELLGWLVVRKNANAEIWEQVSSAPSRVISLQSSATVTVTLWVF